MKKPQIPRLKPNALEIEDLDTLLVLHRAGHLSRDRLEEIVATRLGPVEAMRWFRKVSGNPPGE